jgi:excisionase family DNA binding protein
VAATRPETTRRKRCVADQHDRGGAPSAAERLVYTVPEAGRLLGLSRNGSYEAAKRGEIPTIRIGRLLLVPKVPFHRMIELAPGPALPSREERAPDTTELTAAQSPEAANPPHQGILKDGLRSFRARGEPSR